MLNTLRLCSALDGQRRLVDKLDFQSFLESTGREIQAGILNFPTAEPYAPPIARNAQGRRQSAKKRGILKRRATASIQHCFVYLFHDHLSSALSRAAPDKYPFGVHNRIEKDHNRLIIPAGRLRWRNSTVLERRLRLHARHTDATEYVRASPKRDGRLLLARQNHFAWPHQRAHRVKAPIYSPVSAII